MDAGTANLILDGIEFYFQADPVTSVAAFLEVKEM